jgi:predicted Zn-dependent peptidase
MKKTELQELVQECIAEVLDERKSKGDDEFKRVDKGVKGKVAKDKGEEEVYGAGYAAGEKAAKAKYKKLAEAYKQLKEDGFGIGLRGMEVNDGGKDRSINEEVDLINQIASIDWETAIPVLSAVGLLTAGAVSTLKQALKNPKELADRVRKEM